MLSDILAADVEENIIKLFKNNCFVIGWMCCDFCSGCGSLLLSTAEMKLFPLKSVWISAVKCRLFSYERENSAHDLWQSFC